MLTGSLHVSPAQCLFCPLTESMDTVVYVDEQRMRRAGCTDAQVDLSLRCPQMWEDIMLHFVFDVLCINLLYISGRLPMLHITESTDVIRSTSLTSEKIN